MNKELICVILLLFGMLLSNTLYGQSDTKSTISEYTKRSYSAWREGRYQECIVASTEGIESDSSKMGYYQQRVLCKIQLKDYRGVIKDCDRVLELSKLHHERNLGWEFYDEAWAYFERGKAKINLGLKDGGCWDLSTAGELGKKDAYYQIQKSCN